MSMNYNSEDRFYFDLADQAVSNFHDNWEDVQKGELSLRECATYAVLDVIEGDDDRQTAEYMVDMVMSILSK